MNSISRHGNVLAIGHCGILIEGSSGSGKSSLAMGLIERAERCGLNAAFVADDRFLLTSNEGKLIANVPDTIAGKIEVRGYGIVDLPHQHSCEISVVVRIKADEDIKRMPEKSSVLIQNISLPLVEVPARHEEAAARIVFAWLKDNMGIGFETFLYNQKNSPGDSAPNK